MVGLHWLFRSTVRSVFSFIGYTTQEVPIAKQKVLNIRLAQSIESLAEVMVIGYGTQKKAEITSSVVRSRKRPNQVPQRIYAAC